MDEETYMYELYTYEQDLYLHGNHTMALADMYVTMANEKKQYSKRSSESCSNLCGKPNCKMKVKVITKVI